MAETPTIGGIIRAERFKQELSRAELARKANVDYRTLSALENDGSTPQLDTLERVCNALGLKLDFVIRKTRSKGA